ncbi:MAG: peptidoglycan-binding protein [Hyphomicrobium sp.]|nr:peptidoglycan-binding protein [Hyphomicrobium sp.]
MLEAIKKGEDGSLEEMQEKSADWSADFRRAMQRRLKEEGRYDGPIDGKFGPGVKRAVDELAAAAGT